MRALRGMSARLTRNRRKIRRRIQRISVKEMRKMIPVSADNSRREYQAERDFRTAGNRQWTFYVKLKFAILWVLAKSHQRPLSK